VNGSATGTWTADILPASLLSIDVARALGGVPRLQKGGKASDRSGNLARYSG